MTPHFGPELLDETQRLRYRALDVILGHLQGQQHLARAQLGGNRAQNVLLQLQLLQGGHEPDLGGQPLDLVVALVHQRHARQPLHVVVQQARLIVAHEARETLDTGRKPTKLYEHSRLISCETNHVRTKKLAS